MFFLGLLSGALIVLSVVAWLYRRLASMPVSSYRARAAVRDLERQTIHDLLTAEFAMRRAGGMSAPGMDIIEGPAVEVRRP